MNEWLVGCKILLWLLINISSFWWLSFRHRVSIVIVLLHRLLLFAVKHERLSASRKMTICFDCLSKTSFNMWDGEVQQKWLLTNKKIHLHLSVSSQTLTHLLLNINYKFSLFHMLESLQNGLSLMMKFLKFFIPIVSEKLSSFYPRIKNYYH